MQILKHGIRKHCCARYFASLFISSGLEEILRRFRMSLEPASGPLLAENAMRQRIHNGDEGRPVAGLR
jgi:hypothetical protein